MAKRIKPPVEETTTENEAPKTEDLVAPNITQAVQIGAPRSVHDLDKVKIPGIVLRWVNPATRNANGWSIWHPVEKDTEIGGKILAALREMGDHFGGVNLETSYIYQSANTLLAYAKQADVDALKAATNKRHTDTMRIITDDDAITTNTMMVHRPSS